MRALTHLRLSVLTCGLIALTACGDSKSTPIDVEPTAGVLTVYLESPHDDDGAVSIVLRGDGIENVEPSNADHTLFVRRDERDDSVLRIALIGDELSGGVVKFAVTNVARLPEYSVELLEVADEANRLRPSLVGYSVRVAQQ